MTLFAFITVILFTLNRCIETIALEANETCETEGLITHFDWDDLTTKLSNQPFVDYSLEFDESSLTLTIDVYLEYLGYSFANDHTYGYGVTYVLDFDSFNHETDNIREPGNCQNRLASSYIGKSFNSTWDYSHTPFLNNHLGNNSYLAYPPPSDYWYLSMNSTCKKIHYQGKFSWWDLQSCSNYDYSTIYTTMNTNSYWLNISGKFYIDIVSPLYKNIDSGYYRVYQLLSVPFRIALKQRLDVVSSVNIYIFTITIIAVYRIENGFTIMILTETTDFLRLNKPNLFSSPLLMNFQITITFTDCLNVDSILCSQLWYVQVTITSTRRILQQQQNFTTTIANQQNCTRVNFTGIYSFKFTTGCNPNANNTDICNDYIATYGIEVILTVPFVYQVEFCPAVTLFFFLKFAGIMKFFNDSSYAFQNKLGINDQYAIGDTAYVQIEAAPANGFGVFGYDMVELKVGNIWVCTTHPNNEPLFIHNQNLGSGGCLSQGSIIDEGFPWHLIVSGNENDLTNGGEVQLYDTVENSANGVVQFSFNIDSTIKRRNLYIHAQLNIELIEDQRRRLIDTQLSSQIRHFDGVIGIDFTTTTDEDTDADDDPDDNNSNDDESYFLIFGLLGYIGCITVSTIFIILCLKKIKISTKKKRIAGNSIIIDEKCSVHIDN